MSGINKIVLAYSGGLDTSAIIPWLKENYDAEIIAFVADVGQERDDLEGIEQKAIASGATKCIVKDLREEFVKEYVYPTLKTGAVYEGTYLLGTSMARPIIAKAMVEAALAEGADAISHGCTGKGNDQVRFEGAVAALAPQLKVEPKVLALATERRQYGVVPVTAEIAKDQQLLADAFAKIKLIPKPIEVKDAFLALPIV